MSDRRQSSPPIPTLSTPVPNYSPYSPFASPYSSPYTPTPDLTPDIFRLQKNTPDDVHFGRVWKARVMAVSCVAFHAMIFAASLVPAIWFGDFRMILLSGVGMTSTFGDYAVLWRFRTHKNSGTCNAEELRVDYQRERKAAGTVMAVLVLVGAWVAVWSSLLLWRQFEGIDDGAVNGGTGMGVTMLCLGLSVAAWEVITGVQRYRLAVVMDSSSQRRMALFQLLLMCVGFVYIFYGSLTIADSDRKAVYFVGSLALLVIALLMVVEGIEGVIAEVFRWTTPTSVSIMAAAEAHALAVISASEGSPVKVKFAPPQGAHLPSTVTATPSQGSPAATFTGGDYSEDEELEVFTFQDVGTIGTVGSTVGELPDLKFGRRMNTRG